MKKWLRTTRLVVSPRMSGFVRFCENLCFLVQDASQANLYASPSTVFGQVT